MVSIDFVQHLLWKRKKEIAGERERERRDEKINSTSRRLITIIIIILIN